jgi:hypothetical protein
MGKVLTQDTIIHHSSSVHPEFSLRAEPFLAPINDTVKQDFHANPALAPGCPPQVYSMNKIFPILLFIIFLAVFFSAGMIFPEDRTSVILSLSGSSLIG